MINSCLSFLKRGAVVFNGSCWQYHFFINMTDYDYKSFLGKILEKQSESNKGLQVHMQTVAAMAVAYAKEVGYDTRAANLAGMAHDLFRLASKEGILLWAEYSGFFVPELMRETPMLAHGLAAAGWLMKNLPQLGVDVIIAVRDHTFPPEEAPMLTKILAVADFLEPSRKIHEREEIRLMKIPFEQRFSKVMMLKKRISK